MLNTSFCTSFEFHRLPRTSLENYSQVLHEGNSVNQRYKWPLDKLRSHLESLRKSRRPFRSDIKKEYRGMLTPLLAANCKNMLTE